jgi:Transposase DDE domain group 1
VLDAFQSIQELSFLSIHWPAQIGTLRAFLVLQLRKGHSLRHSCRVSNKLRRERKAKPCRPGCTPELFDFQDLGSRKVVAGFNGGLISSDAGGLLLRELAIATDPVRQLSGCFVDYRNQRFVEHSVQDLVSQKFMGLCLGYEDVVDHDMLRFDPLFATLCCKEDPSCESCTHARDRGKPCAGKSTLNRLRACRTESRPRRAIAFAGWVYLYVPMSLRRWDVPSLWM